jgi:hypothetical protein
MRLFHMDSIEELSTSMTKSAKNVGFVEHVFNFDESTKTELMNIVQYAILAIIPIVLVNKLTQSYVPESDESKPTLEITIEILLQVVFLFVSMYFIHRLITFVPTFSKVDYSELNLLNIVLGFMVIVLSLQTKLGLKVEILSDRLMDYFGLGSSPEPPKKQSSGSVSVSQPIVHNGGGVPVMPQQSHQPSRADSLGNHQTMPGATSAIDQLPNQSNMGMQTQGMMPQQQPNFDSMYQEPFAANDGFGGLGGGFAPF